MLSIANVGMVSNLSAVCICFNKFSLIFLWLMVVDLEESDDMIDFLNFGKPENQEDDQESSRVILLSSSVFR